MGDKGLKIRVGNLSQQQQIEYLAFQIFQVLTLKKGADAMVSPKVEARIPMSDEFSIQQTINRYSEGASRGDWDQVLSTYMPDAVWEIPHFGAKFEGHNAIRDALMHFSGPMDYIVQINAPALLEVHKDTATARSVIRECGKFLGQNAALEVLGFYADTLLRTPDGWKFTRRVFELRGMHRFPLTPA